MWSAFKLALAAVPAAAWEAICAGLAVLLLLCSVQLAITRGHLLKTRADLATQTAAWATERAALADQARQAESQYRATEAQRVADQQAAQEKHDAEIRRLGADVARSAREHDRLRDAVQIAARALRGQAASHPEIAGVSEAGARAAEFLGQCSERYRDVAYRLDRSIAAGQQCQQSYDALTVGQ